MASYIVMKTNMREEAIIPKLAIDSFRQAFVQAVDSTSCVVYVHENKIVEQQQDGSIIELKNVSQSYVVPKLKRTVLKRKAKSEAVV